MANVFLTILGKSNIMKVLDYLLDLSMDVGISDICEGTGLTRKTVDNIINNFVNEDIVVKTRKVEKTQMYKLNNTNPIVEKLFEINNIVLQRQEDKLQTNLESLA